MRQFNIIFVLCLVAFPVFAGSENYKWIEQKAKTQELHFSVKFSLLETEESGPNAPIAIKVIENNSQKVVQEISIKEAFPVNFLEDNQRIGLVDVNFDGYLDISLVTSTGGAGPNDVTTFYVYNSKTKQFKHDKNLTFVLVEVDEKNKTIKSATKLSPSEHLEETYTFIKGRLTLIESINDNCEFKLIKRRQKNGKMETIKEHSFCNSGA